MIDEGVDGLRRYGYREERESVSPEWIIGKLLLEWVVEEDICGGLRKERKHVLVFKRKKEKRRKSRVLLEKKRVENISEKPFLSYESGMMIRPNWVNGLSNGKAFPIYILSTKHWN